MLLAILQLPHDYGYVSAGMGLLQPFALFSSVIVTYTNDGYLIDAYR